MERTIFYLTTVLSVPRAATPKLGAIRVALTDICRSSIARSVAWTLIGSVVAQGGSFLSSVVVARVLGRQLFGEFALVQSTVTALTYLASLGLGLTATKYISSYRISDTERIGKILGLSSILVGIAASLFAATLAICAPLIGGPRAPSSLASGVRLSAIAVFFLTVTGYQTGVLAGFEAFRRIAGISFIWGLATPVFSYWGAAVFGVRGAVLAQCAGAFLLWWLNQGAVRAECRRNDVVVRYRGSWQLRSILVRVSIPAAACGMLGSLASWGSSAILARKCGYGELAVFTAAGNIRSLVIFIPSLVLRVVSPRLNQMFSLGALADYSRAFWRASALNACLALLGALIAFIGGQAFLHLFGKDFAGSDWLLALILTAVVVEVLANNLYQALFAGSRFWWNFAVMTVWTAVLLGVSALAPSRYGARGTALAFLSAWLVATAFYAPVAIRQTCSEGGV